MGRIKIILILIHASHQNLLDDQIRWQPCPQAVACSNHVPPILEGLMDIWAFFLQISNLLYIINILPGRFGVQVVARGGQVGKHVLDGLHVECPVSSALCHTVLAQDIYHIHVLNPG